MVLCLTSTRSTFDVSCSTVKTVDIRCIVFVSYRFAVDRLFSITLVSIRCIVWYSDIFAVSTRKTFYPKLKTIIMCINAKCHGNIQLVLLTTGEGEIGNYRLPPPPPNWDVNIHHAKCNIFKMYSYNNSCLSWMSWWCMYGQFQEVQSCVVIYNNDSFFTPKFAQTLLFRIVLVPLIKLNERMILSCLTISGSIYMPQQCQQSKFHLHIQLITSLIIQKIN